MWVQMIVHNPTEKALAVSLGGTLRARGADQRVFTWGASSADSAVAEPRSRMTHFVGIGEFYKVHMSRDGSLFDIRPLVIVGRWQCALPVEREN
jgi:hypothetical protein